MALHLAKVVGLALAYWGVAHLVGALATPPGFAVPMWPASGIALGALFTGGVRLWPGILIGSFLFNLETTVAARDAIDVWRAVAIPVGIATGATLQGVVGTILVRRVVGGSSGLEDPGEIIRFLVAGGPVSCLINASFSVALLVASGLIPVQESALNWLTWWAGDTMGVLIFAPLFLTVFGKPKHAWRPRRKKVTVPLILCLAAVTALFGALQNWETGQLQTSLAQDADALARDLTRELDRHLIVEKTVATLYGANPRVSGDVLDHFLQSALEQIDGAQAISWVPLVRLPSRNAYEQEVRSEAPADYEIREWAADGRLVRAAERAEYFPVRSIAPREHNDSVLGFDLASDKALEPALRSARASGLQVVTAPIRWVQGQRSSKDLLLLTPVYTDVAATSGRGEQRAHFLGFVSVVFRVPDLVGAAFRGLPGQQLYFRLFDRAPTGERTILYSSAATEQFTKEKQRYITKIQFGGRTWDAEFIPGATYVADQRGWGGWYRHALLIGSLLVISLIGTLLLVFTARERHIALVTGAVARVGRGDRAVRIPIVGHGPLRQLEQGINEMAAQIDEHQAQLERRVEEATAELRSKKEESEAATLAKSRVLAYASHDLRQPLHALELFVSHLKHLPLNDETARIVSNVDRCVGTLGELLNGLLDLSRLDSGLVQPNADVVPVANLWVRLRHAFAETAAAKHLELRFRPSPLSLITDAQLLDRILLNLVSNAIRYTRRGGVLVACRRAGQHARVQVWDTGCGIPAERQQEIFKEFVQLDNAERDQSTGLGLGLTIVERAARVLGHRLSLRSVPGHGSCFTLDVPIADAVTLRTVPVGAPIVADSFSFAGFTALVVEDDFLARRALVDLLRSWNWVVVEARTAEDAQRLLTGGCRPDVIASDLRLPDHRSGIDVVTAARAALGSEVAAVIISGDTHAEVIAAVKAAGLPLLHKPVQAARLRRVLHLLLHPSRTVEV